MVLKVVHIINGLDIGGAEGALVRLIEADRADDHKVISLRSGGGYADLLRGRGVEVIELGMRQSPLDIFRVARLAVQIRRLRPDVVQTWMYYADLIGGGIARLVWRAPVVWGIRRSDLDPKKSKRTVRLFARICARLSARVPARIVCCAHEALRVHGALGYDTGRMVVIANGFDTNLYRPNPAARERFRAELGVPAGARVLGYVARMDPQKDHETLLRALSQLDGEGMMPTLVLAGKGTGPELQGMVRTFGLEDRVVLLGPRTDVSDLMNGLDLHVMSSAFGEGFPNVLCEAMACGTPCVTTDCGDAGRIVGDTGWVVAPRRPDALAEAIRAALTEAADEVVWQQRRSAARQRVVECYSIERMVAGFQEVWRAAMSRGG